ncbi:hypothetical protein V1286_007635 [Bradyrhizobium algeriense]|uniref:Uncharacterized protein n=1 Tax=Bradyrhizobium algeriense TaxID=634784 RepID=A0ABU8BPU5_9BRAD
MATVTTSRNIGSLCRELEKLTCDLRTLSQGSRPSEQDLQACPLLDRWSFGFLPAPCLLGAISHHPIFGARPHIHTSELVLIDPDKRWARTWSKFYRLGKQVVPEIENV